MRREPDRAAPAGGGTARGARPSLLFVGHTSALGGAELALLRFARACDRFHVSAALMEPGPLAAQLAAAGADVVVAAGGRGPRALLGQLLLLRRLQRTGEHDLVVSNTMRAAALVALSRPRGALHCYHLRDGLRGSYLGPVRRWVVRRVVLPRTDALLANSAWTLASVPPGPARRPARVAPSPAGITSVRPAPRDRLVQEGRLRLLSLSRLTPWKGVHVAVEAAHELARRGHAGRVSLTVAGEAHFGEDRYKADLQRLAAAGPAEVRFLGHVEDVQPLLAGHDVLLHTPVAAEPFGQVVVQGLAEGMAVLTSTLGGAADLAAGGAARTFAPGDVAGLATAMEELLTGRADLRAGSARALRRARELTDARATAALQDAYAELLTALRPAAQRRARAGRAPWARR